MIPEGSHKCRMTDDDDIYELSPRRLFNWQGNVSGDFPIAFPVLKAEFSFHCLFCIHVESWRNFGFFTLAADEKLSTFRSCLK